MKLKPCSYLFSFFLYFFRWEAVWKIVASKLQGKDSKLDPLPKKWVSFAVEEVCVVFMTFESTSSWCTWFSQIFQVLNTVTYVHLICTMTVLHVEFYLLLLHFKWRFIIFVLTISISITSWGSEWWCRFDLTYGWPLTGEVSITVMDSWSVHKGNADCIDVYLIHYRGNADHCGVHLICYRWSRDHSEIDLIHYRGNA